MPKCIGGGVQYSMNFLPSSSVFGIHSVLIKQRVLTIVFAADKEALDVAFNSSLSYIWNIEFFPNFM